MPQKRTRLPADLHQVYQTAIYQVFCPVNTTQTLRAGQRSAWLAQALHSHQTHAACYLTACNPLAQLRPATENAQRMAALRLALKNQGWRFDNGQGLDPEHLWPGEDSVLIWGMDEATARLWGQQWQQNAVLWCDADAVPKLLWLR